jgi:hypothetical protein
VTPSERIGEALRNTIAWGANDIYKLLLKELDALDQKINPPYTEARDSRPAGCTCTMPYVLSEWVDV